LRGVARWRATLRAGNGHHGRLVLCRPPTEGRFGSYPLLPGVTEASFVSPSALWAENPCAVGVGTAAAIYPNGRSNPAGNEQ